MTIQSSSSPQANHSELSQRTLDLLSQCVELATRHCASFPQPASGRPIWLSITALSIRECIPIQVPSLLVAEFLKALGSYTVERGLPDTQCYIQRRFSKQKKDFDVIDGGIIDVDLVHDDVPAVLLQNGLPLASVWWPTLGGSKLLYIFFEPLSIAVYEKIMKRFTLSVPGGDPRSWDVSQAQRLPYCLKSTPDGVVLVNGEAALANSDLLPSNFAKGLPIRLAALIGSKGVLTASQINHVEEYLDRLGIPAPASEGHRLYDRCPASMHHSKKCCYVNRRSDGDIFVHCLAGHGGEGPKSWPSSTLFGLASETALGVPEIDPLRDIPLTKAGRDYLAHRLAPLDPEAVSPEKSSLIKAACEIWLEEKADTYAARWAMTAGRMVKEGKADRFVSLDPDAIVALFNSRLRGFEMAEPYHVEYSDGKKDLILVSGERLVPIATRGDGLGVKAFRHEWMATEAYHYLHHVEAVHADSGTYQVIVPKLDFDLNGSSYFNKAKRGVPAFLSKLGIACVDRPGFPAAFREEEWSIDSITKEIYGCVPHRIPRGIAEFDSVQFFEQLFCEGRLPLASINDVRLLLMAIASPLLRYLLCGQLGIYWLTGPSGAGKDLLAEMIASIWQATGRPSAKVKFDLNLAGERELSLSFGAAEDAVFCRAKEAGKNANSIYNLIRLAGTDVKTARQHYKHEYNVPNGFTYIADSAEDLPERREISRRTVMIQVLAMEDEISKGEVLRRIQVHAPQILADLLRRVEAKPPEFYLNVDRTDSRPLGPVGLSRVLGAELSDVRGATLEDLFEAMVDYLKRPEAQEEGKTGTQKARPEKDGRDACTFPVYRISHFREIMYRQVGNEDLFRRYPTGRSIVLGLQRESDYAKVQTGKSSYVPVEACGAKYAFKFVRNNRCFIFVPEEMYHQSILGPTIEPAVIAIDPPKVPNEYRASGMPPTGSEMTFIDSELLNDRDGIDET